jgi:drug/metabolite transporter (DMT)-like permease
MEWIGFTLLAAFMQSWRNALQSKLSAHVSVAGVTLARFLWASPIALLYLMILYWIEPAPLPSVTLKGASFIVGASIMQIVATALMVKLFQQKNYAIGAGLAKSEALVAAILGLLFFGTALTAMGWIGVMIGGVAVFILSAGKGIQSLSYKTLFIGLACGGSFAITSLWIREASLNLSLPFPHRAAWVLFVVISLQTLMLLVYILKREPNTMQDLRSHSRYTVATSFTSCIGSLGWFSAMSLQAVPYVKTLGQIEVLFTLLISTFWLGQKVARKDIIGLILIAIAAMLVMLQ